MSENILGKQLNNEHDSQTAGTFSYSELINSFCLHLKELEKSNQEIKNVRSAVNSWCKSLKLLFNAPPNKEFFNGFEEFEKRYIDKQISNGIKNSTYASRLSLIRSARRFYLGCQKIYSLPESFGKRLKHYLEISNYSLKSLWQHHLLKHVDYSTLVNWIKEKYKPSPSKLFVVEIIERELEIPNAILTSTVRPERKSKRIFNGTEYGQKISRSFRKSYCVWTEQLETEFQGLLEFKTSFIPPLGMKRPKGSRWTGLNKDNIPPSALLVKRELAYFFGFCCLPTDSLDPNMRGLGLNRNILSLTTLTDFEAVEKFVTVFKVKRAGGKYNNGAISFIGTVNSLLRRETGYLFQKPELGINSGLSKDKKAWQRSCVNAFVKLTEIKNSIKHEKLTGGDDFKLGRDPKEPIREILAEQYPIKVIIKMVQEILSDAAKTTDGSVIQSVYYRDALLISLLQANPLRISMFSMMKLDENLVKKSDDSWWIKFNRQDFKNRQFLKDDFEARVPPELWEMIDNYVSLYRPRLAGSHDSSYVFVHSKKEVSKYKEKFGFLPGGLSNIIKFRTMEYIPGCKGFGPHAFRHIVATDIIKNNPEYGFYLASIVLNDSIKTVQDNYSHLKTCELYDPYNAYFSELWNSDLNTHKPYLNKI